MVAFAGVASAQSTSIELAGSAEIGVVGGDTISATTGVVTARSSQFHTDVDVTFRLRGSTDNGLSFGANVDLDEAAVDNCTSTTTVSTSPATVVGSVSDSSDAGSDFDEQTSATVVGSVTGAATTTTCTDNATNNDAAHGGVDFFVEGAFGRLSMGDVDGAFDRAMAEVPTGGTIDDLQEGAGWNGNGGLDGIYDGQILQYRYSAAGFEVSASVEIDDTAGAAQRDPALGVGLTYALDLGGTTVNLGAGYQQGERTINVKDEIIGFSVSSEIGAVAVGLNYSKQSRQNVATDITHIGVGATYTMDAWTFGASYGKYSDGIMGSNPTFSNNHRASSYALTAAYDMGHADLLIGYGRSEVTTAAGVNTDAARWSLGLAMSF